MIYLALRGDSIMKIKCILMAFAIFLMANYSYSKTPDGVFLPKVSATGASSATSSGSSQAKKPKKQKQAKAKKAGGVSFYEGSAESRSERDKRLLRECKGRPNAGACEGYARP
jgi:hypothetical protein